MFNYVLQLSREMDLDEELEDAQYSSCCRDERKKSCDEEMFSE